MIYTIKNSEAEASVNSFGAELKSFKDSRGDEYIYQPVKDSGYWQNSAPVLFPIVGGLKNETTVINDKEYHMKRHGIARYNEFTAERVTDDSITFLLTPNDDTLSRYPFNFEFRVTFALMGKTLKVTYSVKNTGELPMPFALGAHPAFRCPLEEGEKYEDYIIEFEKPETVNRPFLNDEALIELDNTTLFLNNEKSFYLSHSLFDNDAVVFTDLVSKSVKLYSKNTQKGVKMDFDGFKYFGVWSQVGSDAPFVCLEPWTSMTQCADEGGVFTEKKNMMTLDNGKEYEISFTVTIL